MNRETEAEILIVDDEESIRDLLSQCLGEEGYQIKTAENADEALSALSTRHFDLVLSDFRMPGMNGLELLEVIGHRHADVGVLMLTACDDVFMAVQAMKVGALDYVLKPFRLDEIIATVRKALHLHRAEVHHKHYVMHLEEAVRNQTLELRKTFEHFQDASEITLEALVAALDAREHETHAHSRRVSEYTLHLARSMGVDASLLAAIGRGAMLHDIGKIGVSDNILLKPDKLTELEWVEMKKHPQIGYWILEGIHDLKMASAIVLSHQETYDGTGYPRRMKGEDIPLGARIFALIDCFDAITSDRPYRKAASYEIAREEIVRCTGSQFDPLVTQYFLKVPPADWMEIRARVLSAQHNPRSHLCPPPPASEVIRSAHSVFKSSHTAFAVFCVEITWIPTAKANPKVLTLEEHP
jgi:putative two-component system response regulator